MDIAKLMVLCDIATVEAAEELYERQYSAELLTDRAVRMVTRILALGLPDRPERPPAADLGDGTIHGPSDD